MPEELTTVAELEIFGLSVMSRNVLEELDAILIDDLEHVNDDDIWTTKHGGHVVIKNIRVSLRNYRKGNQVRTVEECIYDDQHIGKKKKGKTDARNRS